MIDQDAQGRSASGNRFCDDRPDTIFWFLRVRLRRSSGRPVHFQLRNARNCSPGYSLAWTLLAAANGGQRSFGVSEF